MPKVSQIKPRTALTRAIRNVAIRFRLTSTISLLILLAFSGQTYSANSLKVLNDQLVNPWGTAFLPDGQILVTERGGQLRILSPDGKLAPEPISGLPVIKEHGQGGLLDVVLHPDFTDNQWVYFSYAEAINGGYATAVARGRLQNKALHNVAVIFRMQHKSGKRYHFGSRLAFDDQGYLFITLGDRGSRKEAQNTTNHAGTIVRLHDDGGIPDDNPFVGKSGVLPEIYSYGHRNIQGVAIHPTTGELWAHEHGPQGGDELNAPKAGKNYGWPTITYGRNYGIGTKIGEGTHKTGMEQPVTYWVPSIAPSGMSFVNGECYPAWRGDLLIGSLKFQRVHRLRLEGGQVIEEEELFEGVGRVRDVRQAPNSRLYILTDAKNGKLIEITPDKPC